MDRSLQYNPLIEFIPQLQAARAAADAAADAVAANAAAIVTVQHEFNALAQKMQPYGGAIPQDAIDYGKAWNTLNGLDAAQPALITDAQNKVVAFRTLWQQGFGLYQALLQDPGKQEQV